jgi:uncharacterized protein (DUF488 family)
LNQFTILRVSTLAETIFTIGHSTRSLEDLIAMLKAHGIQRLIDVRSVPRSRTNPQFNRETLPAGLARHGIAYQHEPRLGGLRRARADSVNLAWKNTNFRGYADYMSTVDFQQAVERLTEAGRRERVAIMCAEAVPWRCHRSLVADVLTARGVPVEHVMSAAKSQPHTMTPFARVKEGRVTYPKESLNFD